MKKEQKTITNANEGRQNKLNVPTLRFKGYTAEWDKASLSTYAKKITSKNTDNAINNVICNSAINGLIPQLEFFDKEIANDENTSGYYIINDGDFVYNPRKSISAPYGPVNIYKNEITGIVSPLYLCFTINNINKRFLLYRFKSPCWYRYIYLNGDSGARHDRVSIRDDVFLSQPLSIPSVDEQAKIADFLDKIEARISVQNKIISKYESLIKGISRDYFNKTPDYYVSLNDLIIMGKAGGTPASTISEYYSGYIPFLSISDMTKQGKYIEYTERHISEIGLDNSSAWLVPQNSLILSMYASVGLVCINKVPLATSQAMFSMILKDSDNLDYIYYYLNFFRETQIHRLLETGTQSNINADTVRAITIPFYADKSTYVKSMLVIEKRLNNEKDMLFRLTDLKAYLLSNLFI
ncbi:MAG: restriction endonuclease subunit S [Eubacteriales bacterium]|nr:restriction endonuclease subunit S [Eubacteriales bacterium]